MSTLIKPDQPAGFRDYSPKQMITRRQMIQKIESVYLRFGFLPLQTSTGHKRHVLTGGKNISNRLWNMHVDTSSQMTEDDQHVSARFDLTVPLARFVASHIGEISWPFRRFEVGNVFRGESPQAGDGPDSRPVEQVRLLGHQGLGSIGLDLSADFYRDQP